MQHMINYCTIYISYFIHCFIISCIVPAADDQAQREKEAGGQDSHLKRLSLMLLPPQVLTKPLPPSPLKNVDPKVISQDPWF